MSAFCWKQKITPILDHIPVLRGTWCVRKPSEQYILFGYHPAEL